MVSLSPFGRTMVDIQIGHTLISRGSRDYVLFTPSFHMFQTAECASIGSYVLIVMLFFFLHKWMINWGVVSCLYALPRRCFMSSATGETLIFGNGGGGALQVVGKLQFGVYFSKRPVLLQTQIEFHRVYLKGHKTSVRYATENTRLIQISKLRHFSVRRNYV